jgi:hypothetical protein
MTTTRVAVAWITQSAASQRGPVRITTNAIRAAQPTCRLGMAACWFAISAIPPPYAEGPMRAAVSRKPHSGNMRGGESGNPMWRTSAVKVCTMRRFRAHAYSARGRAAKPHARKARVTGKWAAT